MSNSPVTSIMDRISVATPASQIAVFTSARPGYLNAVFAAPTETIRQINIGKGFIGCYDKTMDPATIKAELKKHVISELEVPSYHASESSA